jgi:hypothetical protein
MEAASGMLSDVWPIAGAEDNGRTDAAANKAARFNIGLHH